MTAWIMALATDRCLKDKPGNQRHARQAAIDGQLSRSVRATGMGNVHILRHNCALEDAGASVGDPDVAGYGA
jgi:hypothetical protein